MHDSLTFAIRSRNPRPRGFTLIEMVLVIILIGIIGALASRRFDTVIIRRQKSEVRKLINVWELLFQESLARGESYRLIFDLNEGTYYVRREVMPEMGSTVIHHVDLLKNLRTKHEKERRAKEAAEDIGSLEEAFEAEDSREQQGLQSIFFQSLYIDPNGTTQLTQPLEFPSLAQPTKLSQGIAIRDIATESGRIDSGEVFIRFSPRGGADFAVLHIFLNEQIYTILLNPWTGKAVTTEGDIDYEWTLGQN